MLRLALIVPLLSALLPDCDRSDGTPVRATLDEGQVLVGEVHTGTLMLEGGLGTLPIPLHDIGEVEPVEGTDLAGSGDHVRVWLRNGSELVGRWAEPSLAVDVTIGAAPVAVDLPMDDVGRLQLRGRTDWPHDAFRVRTRFGDDLYVDAAETRIPLQTGLGAFTPTLEECRSLTPLDGPEGRWRVELRTGTVLVGTIATDRLELALPLGPEAVEVPLAEVLSLSRESLIPAAESGDGWYDVSPVRSQKS